MKKVLAMTLALSISCMSCAFADEATSTNSAPAAETMTMPSGLQDLVTQGIISQETLDAINTYLESSRPEMPDGQSGESAPAKPDGEQSDTDKPDSAPEKPEGDQSGSAPEKPEGDQSGSAPEMPGGAQGGSAPEMPGGMGMMLSDTQLDELVSNGTITSDERDAISAWLSENSAGMGMPGGNPPSGGPGMSSSKDIHYAGATEITSAAELSGETYVSETADESALLISTADSVTVSDFTATKTGDSDGGDNCNFYGLNAAVLAKDGANVTITGAAITSSANGANGVFSYGGNGGTNGAAGDGTTVTISDSTITTTGDGSGGIMTAGGGVTYASNLTIETSGTSSAAIRTDRGGGTVVVDGGSYTTNGLGSPAIYSTANITVSNAELTSNLSEGVCIEGKNSITLTNCDFTVSNTQCNGHATFFDSIMIYQSMSGDADSGTSAFSMTGGSLTSQSGHVFHVTNTHAVVTLNNVTIINEDSDDILFSVCDDGWNGAANEAELNAVSQTLSGKVLVGSNSILSMSLTENSSFTGCISGEITNSRGETVSTEVGEVNVSLDSTSTWTLTADCYITSFEGDASQVISNGYTLYVNGVALEGVSESV